MPIQLLFLCIFLILLFLLFRKISTLIYAFFFLLTKNRGVAIGILSFLFLPGTMIHELSHFLVATLLRVPAGKLTVIPTIEKDTNEIKAGKLMIAKTDPFRYTLIGIAPMIIGLILIYMIGNLLPSNLQNISFILLFVLCYMFFVISTTMFSSRKDLESLIIVAPITFLIIASLYKVGVRIFLDEVLIEKITSLVTQLNFYLGISLIINFVVFAILTIGKNLSEKLLGRKI